MYVQRFLYLLEENLILLLGLTSLFNALVGIVGRLFEMSTLL
jgi:hypothetical protein